MFLFYRRFFKKSLNVIQKSLILLTLISHSHTYGEHVIHNVWGDETINNPILEKMMESPIMTRLHHIDQSGPVRYFNLVPPFSRYEHSVGVMCLLIKANVSFKEKVAGLFHDASHTAFSHVGDHLFDESNGEKSYQDKIHLEYLQKQNIEDLLGNTDINVHDLDPDLPHYNALETHHPDLCADRIQYIIHTAVILKDISKEQSTKIINDLAFKNNQWYFTDVRSALIFGHLSLKYTQHIWGAPWNFAFYEMFTLILKDALQKGYITEDSIKYGTDQDVLNQLHNTPDPVILSQLESLYDIHNLFTVTPYQTGTLNIKPKFRGVDPFVLYNDQLQRLSTLDTNYKKDFHQLKQWCHEGYGINFTHPLFNNRTIKALK